MIYKELNQFLLTQAVSALALAHKALGKLYGERDKATDCAYKAWNLAEKRLTELEKEE